MTKKSVLDRLMLILPPLFLMGATLWAIQMLFMHVDLKPRVESNFFFAESDAPYQEDLKIKTLFPEPDQMVLAVKGPIHSALYREKIKRISIDLLGLAQVFAVQSLSMGPQEMDAAADSPLWSRVLFSEDGKASLIALFLRDARGAEIYRQVEQIAAHYEDPEFRVVISGPPYVTDLIRMYLLQDLKTFSLAAFGIFSLIMLCIFRSLRILIGTVVACTNASVAALFAANALGIQMGPLTANLSTIVFVLTLSHIAYITFNWKHLVENPGETVAHPALESLRMTLHPSFWSMFTTFLGFGTLIFLEATPLRRLGISGAIGTVIAFLSAYIFFPPFLRWKTPREGTVEPKPQFRAVIQFLSRKHPGISTFIFLAVIGAVFGVPKINHDPGLLTYFQENSSLRDGLDYVDRNWGSSSLKFVVRDQKGRSLNRKDAYKDFWEMQKALEEYTPVGSVFALPPILAEAQERGGWLARFVGLETILKYLERPEFGGIVQMFVTPDRMQALVTVHVSTLYREEPRSTVIDKIKTIISARGFAPVMTGGLYLLQGELAEIILSSLFKGLGLLLILFCLIGLIISRSLLITGTMFISLIILPAWLLGMIGHLQVPLDIISAPATNLAIAMGVDAMMHVLLMVRRLHLRGLSAWQGWMEARLRLWKPVLASMALVCSGFLIFGLSYFPPTQRFGFAVVCGSIMAPMAALLIMPTMAGTEMLGGKRRKRRRKKSGGSGLHYIGRQA